MWLQGVSSQASGLNSSSFACVVEGGVPGLQDVDDVEHVYISIKVGFPGTRSRVLSGKFDPEAGLVV